MTAAFDRLAIVCCVSLVCGLCVVFLPRERQRTAHIGGPLYTKFLYMNVFLPQKTLRAAVVLLLMSFVPFVYMQAGRQAGVVLVGTKWSCGGSWRLSSWCITWLRGLDRGFKSGFCDCLKQIRL